MTIDVTTPSQPAQAEAQKSNIEQNLVQMRKLLEKERAEKEHLIAQNRKFEQERSLASSKIIDDDEDSSEPYVDPKTLRKKLANMEARFESIVEKKAEEKARSLMQEDKRQSYLKSNADFDQIMAPEVVQRFADKHPAMAEAILRMPDGFERQQLVYEAIKNTGAHKKEEVPSIQAKIDANRKTPFYNPSGIGTAPYASQGDFSDTGQKSAYGKMQELKNRLRLG